MRVCVYINKWSSVVIIVDLYHRHHNGGAFNQEDKNPVRKRPEA